MQAGIELVLMTAHEVSSWDQAVWLVPAIPMSAFVISMGGALWLCLWSQSWRYWGIAALGVGMSVAVIESPPDIKVNEKGTLFAVRDHYGDLVFSDRRSSRRARDIWLRRNGQGASLKWSELDATGKDGNFIRCDSLSCLYRPPHRPELTIALVRNSQALSEDCHRADIVISAVPTRFWCQEPDLVIDRFDLWRAGAHAIWITKDGVRIETVAGVQGQRPWSKYPPKKRTSSIAASTQPDAPGS